MTWPTWGMSSPRAATSVATRIGVSARPERPQGSLPLLQPHPQATRERAMQERAKPEPRPSPVPGRIILLSLFSHDQLLCIWSLSYPWFINSMVHTLATSTHPLRAVHVDGGGHVPSHPMPLGMV